MVNRLSAAAVNNGDDMVIKSKNNDGYDTKNKNLSKPIFDAVCSARSKTFTYCVPFFLIIQVFSKAC